MSASISIWLVSLAAGLYQANPGSEQVIAPGATLEKLWGDGAFTEGGALAADGSILFSDIGDRIMRYDPKSGQTTVFREPSGRANGMIFDASGRLIVAEGANSGGRRRVSITERDGTVRTLADKYDAKAFNSPNDVAVDSQGRVYVSDPRYVGEEPRDLDFEGVFLIGREGDAIPLLTTAIKPNGLALSPDEKTLYISDNGRQRRVLIAAQRGANGKVSSPKVIHDFGAGDGIDGMTVTVDGRIVAAGASEGKGAVLVISPAGKIVATIPVPEEPANVEFGGDDRKTLYIMAGKSLYRIKTTMTGYHLWPPAAANPTPSGAANP
jgi:gluconolactonase